MILCSIFCRASIFPGFFLFTKVCNILCSFFFIFPHHIDKVNLRVKTVLRNQNDREPKALEHASVEKIRKRIKAALGPVGICTKGFAAQGRSSLSRDNQRHPATVS